MKNYYLLLILIIGGCASNANEIQHEGDAANSRITNKIVNHDTKRILDNNNYDMTVSNVSWDKARISKRMSEWITSRSGSMLIEVIKFSKNDPDKYLSHYIEYTIETNDSGYYIYYDLVSENNFERRVIISGTDIKYWVNNATHNAELLESYLHEQVVMFPPLEW